MPKTKHNELVSDDAQPTVSVANDTQSAMVPASIPAVTTRIQRWVWVAIGGVALIAGLLGFIIGERVGLHGRFTPGAGRDASMNRFEDMGGRGGMMQSMRGTRGKVTAVSPTSVTVNEFRDNTPVTYTVDASTRVTKADRTAGSISDVKVGDEVAVHASTASQQLAGSIVDLGVAQ